MTAQQDKPRRFDVGDDVTVLINGRPHRLARVTKIREYKIRTKVTVTTKGDVDFNCNYDGATGGIWDDAEFGRQYFSIRLTQPGDADVLQRRSVIQCLRGFNNWDALSLDDAKAVFQIFRAAEAKERSNT